MNPKVAIIIPVYNAEKYLAESLNSIVSQNYDNKIILIADDCSTDGSYEIAKGYSSDNVIIFKSMKNNGVPITLNFLLSQANDADLIARHDADDISLPERISKQVEFMELNPDIALCGTWYIHMEKGNEYQYRKPVTDDEIRRKHFSFNSFVHGSLMFRNGIGNYDENCSLWEPEDFMFTTEIMKKYKVANIPEYLYKWRCYPDNRCAMAGKELGTGRDTTLYKIWCNVMGIEFNRKDLSK